MNLAFIQNIGPMELVIIFFVVLIFFGAKRLPNLFYSFGKSIKEFKKATTEVEQDIRSAMDEEPKKVTTPPQTAAREEAPKKEPEVAKTAPTAD